jgi:putative transposase
MEKDQGIDEKRKRLKTMEVIRGYKTEMNPNNRQVTMFRQHAGIGRFAWNWALARVKNGLSKPNAMELHKEWNEWKKENAPWAYDVSKAAPQEKFRDLQKAFSNFFKGQKEKRKVGYPKFRSKKNGLGTFRLTGALRVESKRIKMPRIGWVRLKERDYIPVNAHILSVTVSEKAGRWFVSVQVKEDAVEPFPASKGDVLGIDLGTKDLAICSDSRVFENPKILYQYETKLKRLQRKLSKQKKGGSNRKKTQHKIARLHLKIANARLDYVHKATTSITKTKGLMAVVMEDLNIRGMVRNHKLAKSIHDASMGMFSRQMEYKTYWNGMYLQRVGRFFPSTKMCSGCGNVKQEMPLSERTYCCDGCGLELDRDVNAALNLRNQFC